MKLSWDNTGEHFYKTGVDHGVVYPYNAETGKYTPGEAWNGITAVTENPSGAESNPQYADNIKYLDLTSAEEFGFTIEAYTYPDTFAEIDGTATVGNGVTIGQQPRKTFGFAYRNRLGNDVVGDEYGYELNLIYGAKAQPSEQGHSTVNDSPEPSTFSWECTTTPVAVTNYKNTAFLKINSTKVAPAKLAAIEEILYGTDGTFVEFTGSSFDTGTDYFTKDGDNYTKTTDTSPVPGTTYYTETAGVAAELPSPDTIISMIAEG